MFKKKPLPPMDEAQVQPTWEQLCLQEWKLRRGLWLSRLLQPLGAVLFLLLLYPATVNLALAIGSNTVETYLEKLPLLPALTSSLPHGSVTIALVFLLAICFLIPLAISGLIFTAVVLAERKKPYAAAPLVGTPTLRARTLVCKAEELYSLRSRFLSLPFYPFAGILTALMAVPIVVVLLDFAKEGNASPLYYALGFFALLLCLFVLFWGFALLYWCFFLLNSLFFRTQNPWKIYAQYHRLDAYWESIDPAEHDKRERAAFEKRRRRRKDKKAQQPDNADA